MSGSRCLLFLVCGVSVRCASQVWVDVALWPQALGLEESLPGADRKSVV